MKQIDVTEDTLALAYNKMLIEFDKFIQEDVEGHQLPCEAYNTSRYSAMGRMTVLHPLEEPMISMCGIHDPHSLQQYVMEMLDGILDFEIEKGNWKYTYHDRMVNPVNQIQAAIDELKGDLYSRRAVIGIRSLDDVGSDDPACLQHIQFIYDKNALNMYVMFRSNDLAKATFMNAYALIRLGEYVCKEVGVPMGAYIHTANDLHVYEQDVVTVKEYTKRLEKTPEACLADYKEDWQELMEDEIEDIHKIVKMLKK
jgi:thymidylate synthase